VIVEISPKCLLAIMVDILITEYFLADCKGNVFSGRGIGVPTLGREVLILRCVLLFDNFQLIE